MAAHRECSIMRASESAACARILQRSFERDTSRELSESPESQVWVVREDDGVRGLAVVRDRSVGFGGRFVRAACVSSVCVDPDHRSRGLGRALVESLLRGAEQRGVGLALLIPLDPKVYTRHGFVHGGTRFGCEFELPRALARDPGDRVRPFETSDVEGWRDLAHHTARLKTGVVIPTASDRARRSRAPRRVFVAEREGRIVASVTLSQHKDADGVTLYLHEFFALDARAAESVWSFSTRFSTQARRVKWRAAPTDPLAEFPLALGASFSARGVWMARVLDERRVLSERGFTPGLRADFTLQIHDSTATGGTRPFALSITDGAGIVRESAAAAIRCDSPAFTSLTVGARTAAALAREGRLNASLRDIAELDLAFGLPPSALHSLP